MVTNHEPNRQSQAMGVARRLASEKASGDWENDGGAAMPARKRVADVSNANPEEQTFVTVELTVNQVRALRDLLETQISDLGAEIHHTRTRDYHEMLKSLRESFKKLDRELAAAGS